MTDQQINIAIAKACGWKFIEDYCHGADQPPEYTTVTPDGIHLCGYYPDYCTDLNACHELEKMLDDELDLDYSENLESVTGTRWGANNSYDMSKYRSATARQRCEAYIKTIGKWIE